MNQAALSTNKYAAYPDYKDSGVEWLDALPSMWQVHRTKRMFSLKRELVGDKSSNYQLLSLTLRGIIPRDISTGEGKIPADFGTYQKVDENDLVFCLFDMDETPRTIGLSHQKGMITGAYNVYECTKKCHPSYACYYFLHIDSFKGLKPFYTGLRKVVRSETFGNVDMPCPSYEEQEIIANFLDHETAKIDTLIEEQQSLIRLLQEKRQAVISHAVTKGLNPQAPMKDSGVEWLGEVPEHWLITKLKYCINTMDQGWSPQCDSRPAESDEYGVLKVGCVNGGTFKANENKALPEELSPKLEYQLKKGQLLVSRANTKELVGSAAVVKENHPNLMVCDKLYRIELFPSVSPTFVSLLLGTPAYREQIELGATGASSSMQNIGQNIIRELYLAIPETKEMDEILEYVRVNTSKYDELIEDSNTAIKVMLERRTALVSAAVTGKIDVRNWVAPTSEKQEQPAVEED